MSVRTHHDEIMPTAELCRPADEVDALGVIAALEAEQIPLTVTRHRSTAYPGILDRGPWGTVRVAQADLEHARGVLSRWREELCEGTSSDHHDVSEAVSDGPYREPLTMRAPAPSSQWFVQLLLFASLAVNVYFGVELLRRGTDAARCVEARRSLAAGYASSELDLASQ